MHWNDPAPDGQTVEGMRGKVFTNANSTSATTKRISTTCWTSRATFTVGSKFRSPRTAAMMRSETTATMSSLSARATRPQAAGVPIANYQQFLYYFPHTLLWAGRVSPTSAVPRGLRGTLGTTVRAGASC